MGKVLLSMELGLLALTNVPGLLMGGILCELSAEGKFSTRPELPHAGSAVPRGVEGSQQSFNNLSSFRKKPGSVGGTGRCVPALGWPPASRNMHSHGRRAVRAPASILQTHEPGNPGS